MVQRSKHESDLSSIDVDECLTLGGFSKKSPISISTDELSYWEAVKEELYTRIFSIVPCEIYCNWINGRKWLSLLLAFLCMVGASAHGVFVDGPIYVHCWIIIASSVGALLAPLHAIVWISPLVFGIRHRYAGLCTIGSIILLKVVGLVVGKRLALDHERRLLRRYIRKHDLRGRVNVEEKMLLYLLGFDGLM